MENAPQQIDNNTEIQILERLARMEVRTTETYYPWKNKAETVIKIIKVKAKRRRVQSNISNRVWDFGMVLEAETYSRNAGKYERLALERLRGDTVDISEWFEFEFYELV